MTKVEYRKASGKGGTSSVAVVDADRLAELSRMRRNGDNDGADKSLRIIVAIGELGEPPTDANPRSS